MDEVVTFSLPVIEPPVKIAFPPLDFIFTFPLFLFVSGMGFPTIGFIFILKCDLKEKQRPDGELP